MANSEENFSDLGRVEAIARLYEGTPYKAFEPAWYEGDSKAHVYNCSKILLEGIDFDLTYFPLKHLGHKSVTSVTGELFANMAHPKTLSVSLGISAKLDFSDIKSLWQGIVTAAKEYGYGQVALDLVPSRNGLCISLAANGEESKLTATRKSKAKSMDLICISGNIGGAFFGLQMLEREKKNFEKKGVDESSETLSKYKMMVGSYLMPELDPNLVSNLEKDSIIPSYGYLVTRGLADAVKRLTRDSGLGTKIYTDKIPFEGNTFALGKELGIDPISAAMNGGEDYKIIFVVPILEMEKFRRDFQTFEIIGHLAQPEVGSVLVTPDGVEIPLRSQGWREDEEE